MKPIQAAGLLLALVGIGLLALGLQFPSLSYCLGAVVFGICAGSQINYSVVVWVALIILGLLMLVLGRGRGR